MSDEDFYCQECGKPFHSKDAYRVIESVLHRLLECPKCGSRLTKPREKKESVPVVTRFTGKPD